MNTIINLKPHKIIGLNLGLSNPFFFKRNNINFFISSIHSSLDLFNTNTLMIRAKSPFLHHKFSVSHFLSIKNRTMVVIKNTIHILDYLIPLTRLSPSTDEIIFFLTNGISCITYHKSTKKITLMNPWNFKIISKLILLNEIIDIQFVKFTNFKELIVFLNNKNEVEIWNLKKRYCLLKFFHNSSDLIYSFNFLNSSQLLVFGFASGKIIIYSFIQRYKISEIKIKNMGAIFNIFSTHFSDNLMMLRSNKYLILFNILKNNFIKIKSINKYDKVYCIESARDFISFLKLEIYEKKIFLFKYYFTTKKFDIKLSRVGNKFPIDKLKNVGQLNNEIAYTTIIGEFHILKYNCFKNKIRIELNLKRKNRVKIKEFQLKSFFFGKKILYLAICFYRSYRPFVWKINRENTVELNVILTPIFRKSGRITSICFSKNANYLLLGYQKNLISLLNLKNGKYLHLKKNHNLNNDSKFCQVVSISYDKNNEFFLTGCSCGLLAIWDTYNFTKIKLLHLKKKIYALKWCEQLDMIISVTKDNQIYIICPETFLVIRIYSGHKKKITDFLVLRNSNFIITSSLDKSIKIWNFIKNKCESTFRFLYYPINLYIDKNEKILISTHRFTLGLGLFNINEKNSEYKALEFHLKLIEKNGKLPILKIQSTSFISFSICKKIYKRIFKKKNIILIHHSIENKKKFYQINDDAFNKYFRTNPPFSQFEFDYVDYPLLKNLLKIQAKKYKEIKNFNMLGFLLEIFIDNFTCDMKLEIWFNIFFFLKKNTFLIINAKNEVEPIFKRILTESNRKYSKYVDLDYFNK
jgi:WD40 repeat protein